MCAGCERRYQVLKPRVTTYPSSIRVSVNAVAAPVGLNARTHNSGASEAADPNVVPAPRSCPAFLAWCHWRPSAHPAASSLWHGTRSRIWADHLRIGDPAATGRSPTHPQLVSPRGSDHSLARGLYRRLRRSDVSATAGSRVLLVGHVRIKQVRPCRSRAATSLCVGDLGRG
jgi:hypothetical protein